MTGLPAESTGTITKNCESQLTASIRREGTPDWDIAFFAALFAPAHHADGSCSTPPPGRIEIGTFTEALAIPRPASDITAALGPPLPRSIASTYRDFAALLSAVICHYPIGLYVPAEYSESFSITRFLTTGSISFELSRNLVMIISTGKIPSPTRRGVAGCLCWDRESSTA